MSGWHVLSAAMNARGPEFELATRWGKSES